MASSQVEMASSSPFSRVLRDHNRRDGCSGGGRESNARATFQKNLKDLVRDHLQSCISAPSENSDSGSVENSHRQIDNVDSSNEKNSHGRSKIHDNWARAREIVFPIGRRIHKDERSSNASTFQRENSPANSDSSVEIPNLGAVSSLVRRWRDLEAEAKNLNSNSNPITSPVCSSRSNSGSIFTENASILEVPPRSSEACEPIEERYEAPTLNEDNFADWESDRTAHSGPSSSRGRDSDAAESEKLRVADIIRKLTSGDECNDCEQALGNESLPRVRIALDHQAEGRAFLGVTCSPRIRGRQAFADLLMQVERDRHRELEGLVERKSVSRFSQRGRIQALLRVRFLRHGAEVKYGLHSNSRTSELNQLEQGSTIMHLREIFSTGVDQGAADSRSTCREAIDDTPGVEKASDSNQLRELVDKTPDAENSSTSNQLRKVIHHQDVTDPRSSRKEVANTNPDVESSSASNQLKECIHHNVVKMTVHKGTPKVQNSESLHEEASPWSDVTWKRTSYEVTDIGSQESADTVSSLGGCKENRNAKDQEANDYEPLGSFHDYEPLGSFHDWINDISHPHSVGEEQEPNNRQIIDTCCGWVSDISHPQSEWGEEQSNDQELVETSQDWISDIARPRSDWEGLRQERYQEMLDPYLDNRDIRQLLERKSVSSFLSSGMRESIDQLMMSRTQRQPHQMGSRVEEEQKEEVEEEVVEEQEEEEHEEDGDGDGDSNDDDEEEDESPIGRQYNEFGEYADQTTSSLQLHSPSLLTSWSRIQDHEATDDSDQVTSPSMQQSQSSNSYSQDDHRRSSFLRHSSVEMELIYDLRGHMEQLHQEMSEIRKSIKSCINMQSKLQCSIKEEVAAAISHSVKSEGRKLISKIPRKGNCCVCCEMQVDSLLYRCGHMCTCFKCAHELQRSSGSCPVCRAPILDVVRAYAYDR